MSEFHARLGRYTGLAAIIPAASAQAAVYHNDNANISLSLNQTQLVDFGSGFGGIFQFALRGTSTSSYNPPNQNTHSHTNPTYGSTTYGAPYTSHTTTFTTTTTGGNARQNRVFHPLIQRYGGSDAGFIANIFAEPTRLPSGALISGGLAFAHMNVGSNSNYDLGFFRSVFGTASGATQTNSFSAYGSWYPDSRGFLGFTFGFAGHTYYGWFDVETRANLSQLLIHAWAFGDGPIAAGEIPASGAGGVALLAMGAAGVRRTRRSVGDPS